MPPRPSRPGLPGSIPLGFGVLDEESFDFGTQLRVVGTPLLEQGRTTGRIARQRRLEDGIDPLAALGSHRSEPPSWSCSQARANRQRVSTVVPDPQCLGDLADRQPTEDVQFHDLRWVRMGLSEAFEGLVQVDHVHPLFLEAHQHLVQGDASPTAPALAGVAPPGVVNQDLAHRLDRRSEDVAGVGGFRDCLFLDEAHHGLVNQGTGLQGVVAALAPHHGPRDPQQVLVNRPDQSIPGVGVAGMVLVEHGVTPPCDAHRSSPNGSVGESAEFLFHIL